MDLRKRLAQLDRLTRKPERGDGPDSSPSAGNIPGAVDGPRTIAAPPADPATTLAGLGLRRRETPAGPVWESEHLDSVGALPDPLPGLSGLFPRTSERHPAPAEILLLDTETTGLAGGTGTLVFQVGASWWEPEGLRTRQYFLPGPGHESALLADLAALAGPFSTVVTFNGASFDLPLLRTRALLNRLPDPLAHLTGWDLLVPARRLWGYRLPDCRQQTIEHHLCGRARGAGDIDGSCIPQAWFDFLATGKPGLLGNVLTHNRRDMVGMAGILVRICELGCWFNEPADRRVWPPAGLAADLTSAWALARILERRGEPETAAGIYRQAWRLGWGELGTVTARHRFRRDAVRNLKRIRHWDLVEEIVLDGLGCDAADPAWHREAAILYEHRLIDLERALLHAVRAGDEHRTRRLKRLLEQRAG